MDDKAPDPRYITGEKLTTKIKESLEGLRPRIRNLHCRKLLRSWYTHPAFQTRRLQLSTLIFKLKLTLLPLCLPFRKEKSSCHPSCLFGVSDKCPSPNLDTKIKTQAQLLIRSYFLQIIKTASQMPHCMSVIFVLP